MTGSLQGSGSPFEINSYQASIIVKHAPTGVVYCTQGRAALPFLGGTLCAAPPLRRTDIQNAGGSTPPVSDCSGTFSFDVNAWIGSSINPGPDPFLVPGATIHGQFWSRDPGDPNGANLTNAVERFIYP